jgi:hypothetical protein
MKIPLVFPQSGNHGSCSSPLGVWTEKDELVILGDNIAGRRRFFANGFEKKWYIRLNGSLLRRLLNNRWF